MTDEKAGGGEASPSQGGPWLHIRREPFEFGLLPISALIHKEGAVANLKEIRSRLVEAATSSSSGDLTRVSTKHIATCLKLPEPQARLVLDSLAAVLPTDGDDVDPLAQASIIEADNVGADVDHLMLFLFIQSYKRAAQRASYRDPAVTADVWPQGPSPFDNVSPTATSALQLKTSLAARQRSLPGQAEEETHQLAFVHKHLAHLLSLLADEGEGGEEVISLDKFETLGLLLRVNRIGNPTLPLSHVAPFFANSDPSMPAAPVPLATVKNWLALRICFTSDHGPEFPPLSPKAGSDVAMVDAHTGSPATPEMAPPESPSVASMNGLVAGQKRLWAGAGVSNVDGIAKMSVLKGEHEVENGTVRVAHCHDSVIYILAPLKYASVMGCSDSIVVLGPVGKCVRVETCERMQLIVPCARVKISNCRECVFYLGSNSPPLIFGDNHNIQIAPFNTFYPKLDYHLAKTGVTPAVNQWDSPTVLHASDLHEPLSPVAPQSPATKDFKEPSVLLPPEKFVPFVVPFRGNTEQQGSHSPLLQQQTRSNPFALPKLYLTALQQKTRTVESLRQTLKTAVLEEGKKKELTNVIQAHFKEWLLTSGNIRQIYDLARLDRDP